MTSLELTSGFDFWSGGHLRKAVVLLPIKFGVDICIQSRIINIFPKFKMAAAAILDFQFMWIWPFRCVDSVVFVFGTKFGSNICYCRWDRCTYASDIHLMTSRELTSGFDFWSRGHLRMPVVHLPNIIWCKISLSSPKLLTFFWNSRWRPPPSWIFSLCEFGHSGVLIVWYLCSVPNLVKISIIVTEIDAHMLQTLVDDVTRINFRFRLLVTLSSLHGHDASFHEIWCRYLYPIWRYWYFSEIKDGGRRHLGFVWVSHGTTHEASFMARTSCKNFVMIG